MGSNQVRLVSGVLVSELKLPLHLCESRRKNKEAESKFGEVREFKVVTTPFAASRWDGGDAQDMRVLYGGRYVVECAVTGWVG